MLRAEKQAARPKHIPLRRCAVCGTQAPKGRLRRIVRAPDGAVTLDLRGKGPGRGAYLCGSQACWDAGLPAPTSRGAGRVAAVLRTPLAPEERLRLRAELEAAPRPAGAPGVLPESRKDGGAP